MSSKKKELGKGIRALLANIETQEAENPVELVKDLTHTIASLPVDSIEPNPNQPRTDFDPVALNELSESLKVHGLIQPVTVRRMPGDKFQIISGERRFRASKMAGLKEIPAYIRIANDQEILEMALVENIQRKDLNPLEVAFTYQRLLDECNLTHEALATRVAKD
ncbi:MAG TPA: ParB/RepB/Spo0J family partition protein, partial [Saprospiraceae bacterium]|nr:ParB/RepB/Spo0J family partition protein [Saprospiraceae bacterium]